MKVRKTPLSGLVLIQPESFHDERGFFLETYQSSRYREAGIADAFVQDNHSRSKNGVLRGLHYQVNKPQAQLLTVMRGRIFDVAVDLRKNSPTFARWFGAELSDQGFRQIYMAPGFAHGFYVLSDWADLHYKVTQEYDSSDEGGLLWCDPEIAIEWPVPRPMLSQRDASYPRLSDINLTELPRV